MPKRPAPLKWAFLLAALTVSLNASARAAEVGGSAAARVFTINEMIVDKDTQDLALSVPSQMLIRPWFRWRHSRNYAKDAWVIAPFHERGISFGGGITMSAIYRGENGISEATFLDLATRDPWGKLYPAFGNASSDYFHGAIDNKKFLDYALAFAQQQIDAGVDSIFMDEVNGAYNIHEGFDDYGLAGFRAWLTKKYCAGEKWSATDERWGKRFKIDLRDAAQCPDGTIKSFNYSQYLQKHGWADKPDHRDNPLREEWGFPNDLRLGKSYRAVCREEAWRYQCQVLRDYARAKGRKVEIAANGLNRHVDFQMQNLWSDVLPKKDGRLDVSVSYAKRWHGMLDRSRQLMGREVPVMFFHDWGDGFPFWERLNGDEHKLWMQVYAPELYAVGAFFAFPVHGPFGCDSRKDNSIATIRTLAQFFDAHGDLYRNTKWLSEQAVAFTQTNVTCIAKYQPAAHRAVLHLINRTCRPDAAALAPLSQVGVSFPSLGKLKQATVFSPDAPGALALQPRESQGRTSFTIPALVSYAAVVLDYEKLNPAPMAADVMIPVVSDWARPPQNQFEVGPDGLLLADEIPNSLVQGQLHTELRNNPSFAVHYRQAGAFVVPVERIASQGAKLVVLVDGQKALEAELPAKPKSGNTGSEFNREFSVPIPAGRHRIQVENPGSDWFTVSGFLLRGYGQ